MAKKYGLKTEILLTLVLLLGAALLLGGILMLQLTEKSLLNGRLQQLESMSRVLADNLLRSAEAPGQTSLAEPFDLSVLNNLPSQLDCLGWRLYDGALQPVETQQKPEVSAFSSANRGLSQISAELQRQVQYAPKLSFLDDSSSYAAFLVPLEQDSTFRGALEVYFSLEDIRTNLARSQNLIIVYVLLYGMVLIAAGYFLLHKNVVKPANNLLAATEAVTRGALDSQLPTAGPAEIGQLAAAFNRMVSALKLSREETEEQIAQLEQTNQQLQQTRDELVRSEKLASVGQLSAGLAHELGNPLAALVGYLELLKQRLTDNANRDVVERSLAEAERMDFLVRELLDFSRPDDNSILEDVDPVAELGAAVELLQNQGSLMNVQVLDQCPEQSGKIRINRQKLQQVFVNLLLNAAQACADQGQIRLAAGASDTQVWIALTDDGCGMSAVQKQRIFEPFYTTKEPGQGTGLGLAICQRIVEEAGGRIELESEIGEGSCFRLVFSRFDIPAVDMPGVETPGCKTFPRSGKYVAQGFF